MASTDALPVPLKNTAYRVTFCIWDADGDLVTGATGLDSEVSKDGGAFTDCTNEATEIATSSGCYYLDLTSTEMNADTVAVIVKTSSSGAKTTPIILYPNKTGGIDVDVTAWNGTAIPAVHTAGYPIVTVKDGTGTGEIDTTSGGVLVAALANNAITAAAIAADAITDAKVAADVTIASVTGAVGSVTGNVGGNVTGSVGSLAAQAKADVNAEVLDVLATDTFAEAGSVPAATSTLKDKINWLFALARNKLTQTATTTTLRNDADSGNIGTSTVSDDSTTLTRSEWS
jgi:S-methylmethionine-dependent homocysteine/selenocysteine methylase